MKKGPFGKFAVDVDNGFEPYYVVYADKKKKVAELKRALKNADELFLATDEDREGEAIAWHLLEELKPKVPVNRMVFHEITREAIERALENTRDLDTDLVDAQETRRILDRLYGYEVSPVLWRKVRQGLSAGRVQSVATRLVVERERERMAFVAAELLGRLGHLRARGPRRATPTRASTRASSSSTAARGAAAATSTTAASCKPAAVRDGVVQLGEQAATLVVGGLRDADFVVRSLETKPYTRRPAAPFTTSTLQQEASRKLRFSSRQTMRTAQGLYENGYITYMRTDSPSLSLAGHRRRAAPGRRAVRDRVRARTRRGSTRARPRARRRRTRPSAPPVTRSAPRRRSPARSAATSSSSTSSSGSARSPPRWPTPRVRRRRCASPRRSRRADGTGRRLRGLRHGHHLPRVPRRVRGGLATSRRPTPRSWRQEGQRQEERGRPPAADGRGRRPDRVATSRPTATRPPHRRATPRRA